MTDSIRPWANRYNNHRVCLYSCMHSSVQKITFWCTGWRKSVRFGEFWRNPCVHPKWWDSSKTSVKFYHNMRFYFSLYHCKLAAHVPTLRGFLHFQPVLGGLARSSSRMNKSVDRNLLTASCAMSVKWAWSMSRLIGTPKHALLDCIHACSFEAWNWHVDTSDKDWASQTATTRAQYTAFLAQSQQPVFHFLTFQGSIGFKMDRVCENSIWLASCKCSLFESTREGSWLSIDEQCLLTNTCRVVRMPGTACFQVEMGLLEKKKCWAP